MTQDCRERQANLGQRVDNTKDSKPTIWLRIVQFPLVRLVLLGVPLLCMMAVNGGFMEKFTTTPLMAIAVTIAMAGLGFAF